ncbi:MAG: hypothetical protein KGJ35_00360 [Patescibacteria group bacterium]|nr:hypothetical protein [Patescibacteria group bacterium]
MEKEYHWHIDVFNNPMANKMIADAFGLAQNPDHAGEAVLCKDGKKRNLWNLANYAEAMQSQRALIASRLKCQVYVSLGIKGKPHPWNPAKLGSRSSRASKIEQQNSPVAQLSSVHA